MKKALFCLLLLPAFLTADTYDLGRKLVHKLWHDIQARDMSSIRKYIAHGFQETVPAYQLRRDRREELIAIEQSFITSHKISLLTVSRNKNVIVASYYLEYNKGSPYLRNTVWQKVGHRWYWVEQQGGY